MTPTGLRCTVTGAAGFIGSTLCDVLLAHGHHVTGVDNFCDYYDVTIKKNRIIDLQTRPGFSFEDIDVAAEDIDPVVDSADVVFHLAGQPGVRSSWQNGFDQYTTSNVLGTQRMLEACKLANTPRFVYASSSSVYGNNPQQLSKESDPTHPFSPYGVTKLAGEHLACLYAENFGLSTVSLRFFTVYGPGQRPEMAMAAMIDAGIHDRPFPLTTSPSTIRDFTYVGDIVDALRLAGTSPQVRPGSVYNVCGGSPSTMQDVIDLVDSMLPSGLKFELMPIVAGDVGRTGGDSTLIRQELGWQPQTSLRDGVSAQVEAALRYPSYA